MAARSLRCVAFAYRTCEKAHVPDNEEELAHWDLPEDDLVLLGIVGLKVWKIIESDKFLKYIIYDLTLS